MKIFKFEFVRVYALFFLNDNFNGSLLAYDVMISL